MDNGAANTSFLLKTYQYIGATNQIAPMYSIGAATCKKSAKSVAPVRTIGDINTVPPLQWYYLHSSTTLLVEPC